MPPAWRYLIIMQSRQVGAESSLTSTGLCRSNARDHFGADTHRPDMAEPTKSPTNATAASAEVSNVNAQGALSQPTPARPAPAGLDEVSKRPECRKRQSYSYHDNQLRSRLGQYIPRLTTW